MSPNRCDGSAAGFGDEEWDAAPCGLLVLDESDRVVRANERFLELVHADRAEVTGASFWNDLVGTATRVVYLTQLAPSLQLDGALFEVMIDLRVAQGVSSETVPALLNARRMVDESGRPAGTRIAVLKIKDRRLYEDQLRRARREAEQAREETERAWRADAEVRRRMEFIADASAALAASADIEAMLGALARAITASFADCCIVYTPQGEDTDTRGWAAAHGDAGQRRALEELAARLSAGDGPDPPFGRALDGGMPALLELSETPEAGDGEAFEVRQSLHNVGARSVLMVPSYARAEHVATVLAIRTVDRPPFGADDLTDLTDIAARTGVVLDNLRTSAREHSNSVILQRAVLTSPPATPRAQIATRYLPATTGNDIGGDWYDAFVQPDGPLVVVVGDVMGHDISAAAAMGQLRGLLRTVGYITGAAPADILARTDGAARGLGVDVLATALVARIDLTAEGATVQWSSAGHPPPMLHCADGVRILEVSPDPPLGLGPALTPIRSNHQVQMRSGDVLLIFTDGAVERRGEDYEVGLRALAHTVERARGLDLERLCDLVLETHAAGTRDDIALLALQLRD